MKQLHIAKLSLPNVLIFLFIFGFYQGEGFAVQSKEQISIRENEYINDYDFSTDWFTDNIPIWEKILHSYKGKPNIKYLEIGVFEGRSLLWMLENILTHPTSKATCIDPFYKDKIKQRFRKNLKASGFSGKVTTITGRSQLELKSLPLESFDIIYIDGSHIVNDVMADAVLSWPLLKKNGLVIFDDYLFESELPLELRPKFAIDAFMTAYNYSIGEVAYKGRQVILRKKEFSSPYLAVPFGQFIYVFGQRKLYRQKVKDPEEVPLTDNEKGLIERLIYSQENIYDNKFFSHNEIFKNKDFLSLKDRLQLDLQFHGE